MSNEIINATFEASPDEKKLELVSYLKSAVQLLSDKEKYQGAVYDIAGLMSSDYVRTLPNDDKLIEIMSLAGELEIPDDYTDQKLQSLIELINNL